MFRKLRRYGHHSASIFSPTIQALQITTPSTINTPNITLTRSYHTTSPLDLNHTRPINEPQTAPSYRHVSFRPPTSHSPTSRRTHRFVRSLYSTRCPQSLHRIGSPFFSCTFWLHSPQRYCVVGPASSTAVRKAEPAVVPAAVVVWLEPTRTGGV